MTKIPAFCLTLAETPHRRQAAEKELRRHGMEGVVFFDGVHGPSWGLKTTLSYDYDRPTDPPVYISPGAIGNIMSHWMLWRHILLSDIEQFIVFEDDVLPVNGFLTKLDEIHAELPDDWDLVYLGHVGSESHRVLLSHGERLARIEHPFGTHAMLIRRRALPVLIKSQARAWAPIDIQISVHALPQLNYYCCTPSLASQRTVEKKWPSLVGTDH